MITSFDEKYEYINDVPLYSGIYVNIFIIRDKKNMTEYILKKLQKKKS